MYGNRKTEAFALDNHYSKIDSIHFLQSNYFIFREKKDVFMLNFIENNLS